MNKYLTATTSICLLLCFFLACKNKDMERVETVYAKGGKPVITYDSISINIDTNYLGRYGTFSVYNDTEALVLYGYNHSRHTLNKIQLSSNKTEGIIPLEKDGPNGLNSISAVFVESPDSIFVFDYKNISLINRAGQILKRWATNDNLNSDKSVFSNYRFFAWHNNELFFDKKTNKLYISSLEYLNGISSSKPKKFFSGSILASLDIKSGNVDYYSLSYPEEYRRTFFGFLIEPNISYVSNKGNAGHVYATFPALSTIYRYDLARKQTESYGAMSAITASNAEGLNWSDNRNDDKKLRHYMSEVNFKGIVCDESSQYLFRFHYGRLAGDITDMRDIFSKKKLVLTVLNQQHEIVSEKEIAYKKLDVAYAFTRNNVLYIPFMAKDENVMKFLTLSII